MEFKNKIVVITGGARGIGRCIAQHFEAQGAVTAVIDILDNTYFVGDIAQEAVLEEFAGKVIKDFGRVDILINNAMPIMKGIDACSYTDFCNALKVGVVAPFYLTKLFKNYMPEGSSVINICSTRAFQSQSQTESYSAAKGGVAALTHALAISLGPKIRVNAISPGWIDNTRQKFSGPDASQHPTGRVGTPDDIATMALFLCSEKAGFITAQNFIIDGGMSRQMIYHADYGWQLSREGQ